MIGNGKKNIGFESNLYKSGGTTAPIVYSFFVYIDCNNTVEIFSISNILTIGTFVYTDNNLTMPFMEAVFSQNSFPSPYLPIGLATNFLGLIIDNTHEIGGCN